MIMIVGDTVAEAGGIDGGLVLVIVLGIVFGGALLAFAIAKSVARIAARERRWLDSLPERSRTSKQNSR